MLHTLIHCFLLVNNVILMNYLMRIREPGQGSLDNLETRSLIENADICSDKQVHSTLPSQISTTIQTEVHLTKVPDYYSFIFPVDPVFLYRMLHTLK